MLGIDLLALHMLGDFILQDNYMAANKMKMAWVRAFHCAYYTAPFALLFLVYDVSFLRACLFLLSVFTTHFATDSRRWASDENWLPKPILVDQAIHVITLALLGRILLP